ncbi:2-phospho-L-lactate guanylyltransferase [Rhodococcus sp. NPDC003318]|uniref:2-phospho-L-lactate guanylyltransferase n=1 Tax=Rhodococcus sp. NPDC003318 TaxID=3364503 RepID=UPI0036B25F13
MSTAPTAPSSVRAHVLIAVKDLGQAKSRLTPRLADGQRTELVLAMLRDTLSAARASVAVAAVTVITPDPRVSAAATAAGAHWIPDRAAGPDRLNDVLHAAARETDRGPGPVVALQGDLPCLTAVELTEALVAARPFPRAVVVDHHGTGTSALIVADPSQDLSPRFGTDSARRHIDSGATALRGSWPGLRLDVDTPDDLDAASLLGPGPETARVLRSIGWPRPSARC